MGFSIGDLLNDSVKRNSLARGVQAANIIRALNDYLNRRLGARSDDAKAYAYRDEVVLVACLNSAVSHLVNREEQAMIDAIKKEVPNATVKRIQTRVMQRFPEEKM
jgi:hypothetical protein